MSWISTAPIANLEIVGIRNKEMFILPPAINPCHGDISADDLPLDVADLRHDVVGDSDGIDNPQGTDVINAAKLERTGSTP